MEFFQPRLPFLYSSLSIKVLFSVYYVALTRQISGPPPASSVDVAELQQAFKRVLQSGLVPLPDDGGDEEYYATGRPGSPDAIIEQLEKDDPRAIDFRHKLRTWCVLLY